jgi:hypothetical protein
LRRSLPSTVEVVIAERTPIGVGRMNGEMYLIDERGVAIDAYGPQYSDFDLPIVDGLALHNENERGSADEARRRTRRTGHYRAVGQAGGGQAAVASRRQRRA